MVDISLTWDNVAGIATGAFAVLGAIAGGVWKLTNDQVTYWKDRHDQKDKDLAAAHKKLEEVEARMTERVVLPQLENPTAPCSYFKLKSTNRSDIAGLLNTLEGFWQIYHYAFSRKSQEISISLLIVPAQEIADNHIRCDITDYVDNEKYFEDEGYCFAIDGSRLIYFVFNEMTNGEITAYYTHRPLVPKRRISGVLWAFRAASTTERNSREQAGSFCATLAIRRMT